MKLLLLIPECYNLKTNFYVLKKDTQKNPKSTKTKKPKEKTKQKNPTTAENLLLLTAVQLQ